MPRHQVRMACQRCRRKRAKCDGEDPCERCKKAGQECVFDHSRRDSKDDLRAEIERLRRTNERSDALLDALSSMNDAETYHKVAQGLMDSTVTRQSIYNDLPTQLRVSGLSLSVPAGVIASSLRRNSQAASSVGASSTDVRPATCPHCFGILPAASSLADRDECSGRTSERHPSAESQSEANWLTTPGSAAGSPSLPSLSGDEKLQQVSPWTRTGWSIETIRTHLESLLMLDYLPFCLLCKDPFLQDFASGEGRYCSPALVNSLLALSTRIVDEHQQAHPQKDEQEPKNYLVSAAQDGSPSSGCSDSQALFDEAEALISGHGQPGSLPDIQALGMLALYQASCGHEAEARELAEAFAAAITELCLKQPVAADSQDNQYALVRATTYCGAISLVRILKLLTAQPSGMHVTMLQDDGVTLDQPPCAYGPNNAPVLSSESLTLASEHGSQLSSLQLIPAKVFQLTEWVYKVLASPQTATNDELELVYHRCLDWYESFFSMLKTDGSNSSFVLFIHMYYQFCLLSLFRPHVSASLEGLSVHPREICLQAAQSILALSQSYAGIFGLHRVSPLVPYFVCAAGLLSLAVEEAGHGMLGPVPIPQLHNADEIAVKPAKSPEDTIKKESDDEAMDVDTYHSYASDTKRHTAPSYVNMPALAHARLLLSKMSEVHPAAILAEGMLHRAPGMN